MVIKTLIAWYGLELKQNGKMNNPIQCLKFIVLTSLLLARFFSIFTFYEIPYNFLTIFLPNIQRPRSKYDSTTKNNATI
jgi:hypothetical protein